MSLSLMSICGFCVLCRTQRNPSLLNLLTLFHDKVGLDNSMSLQNDHIQTDVPNKTDQRLMIKLPVTMETKLSTLWVGASLATEICRQPVDCFKQLLIQMLKEKFFNSVIFGQSKRVIIFNALTSSSCHLRGKTMKKYSKRTNGKRKVL